jgi:hypothetical protein
MRSRTTSFALVVTAALLSGAALPRAARAEDDAALVSNAKAAVEYFDKYASKAKDEQKYAELLMDMTRVHHTITVERIGKVLLKEGEEERRMIAAAALAEFRKPKEVSEAAGKLLVKGAQNAPTDDVRDSCIDSMGKLKYRDGVPYLNDVALSGGNPYVLLTTVRVMGEIEDRRALTALLELWERNPVGYSWETGEVNVDTGADGTADQEAAEAEFAAKYGSSMGPKKKPPVMFKVYIQELVRTVNKLTKEKISTPDELRAWMEARRAELLKEGVEIPKYKGPAKKKDDGKGDKKDKDAKDKK